MNYGCCPSPTNVILKGLDPLPIHVKWARDHESAGTYNYRRRGRITAARYVRWEFSNSGDAVLFALKFKCHGLNLRYANTRHGASTGLRQTNGYRSNSSGTK